MTRYEDNHPLTFCSGASKAKFRDLSNFIGGGINGGWRSVSLVAVIDELKENVAFLCRQDQSAIKDALELAQDQSA